jgi:thioredoxin 1
MMKLNWEVTSMADNVVIVSQENFGSVVENADVPVVVDFWASWCVPCRMVTPLLEEIAQEQSGGVLVAKVNVDENSALAERYGVRSIPTLIRFDHGQETNRVVGALPKAQLSQRLGL